MLYLTNYGIALTRRVKICVLFIMIFLSVQYQNELQCSKSIKVLIRNKIVGYSSTVFVPFGLCQYTCFGWMLELHLQGSRLMTAAVVYVDHPYQKSNVLECWISPNIRLSPTEGYSCDLASSLICHMSDLSEPLNLTFISLMLQQPNCAKGTYIWHSDLISSQV